MPNPIFHINPRRLAVKLYGLLGLAVAAIVTLAGVGAHVAMSTAGAAIHLSNEGLTRIVNTADLAVLFEQHRRIVEAASADVGRQQIERRRNALRLIEDQISALAVVKTDPITNAVALQLPTLSAQASSVLSLTEDLALDRATEMSGQYQQTAAEMRSAVFDIRARQQSAATMMVQQVISNAQTLTHWGTGASMVALIILAPIGLLVLGDAARRLRSLWRAMYYLAHDKTDHPVPFQQDLDEVGDMARAIQVFKDNAIALAAKRTEVEKINHFLDIALNNMARGLSMFDAQQRLVICNASYRTMYGLPSSLTVSGTPWHAIEEHRSPLLKHIETPGFKSSTALQNVRDITTRTSATTAHQTMHDGRIIAIAIQPLGDGGWVAIHEDVTQQREAEARITKLARHDLLTGLSNRLVFREEIELRLNRGTHAFALMLIDLDRFKQVNDTLGHPIGDALLQAVTDRLRKLTRKTDVVARLGGDEFAILQDGASTPDACEHMATRLIDALSEPYGIQGHRVLIGASIGIARCPDEGTTASALFGNADLALYHSKGEGRGRASIYTPEMKAAALAERTLEADLKTALLENQFELHYQPILCLEEGRTVCCEALLRWRHPTRGLVPPLDFIPFAETSGLIIPIGLLALRKACADAVQWPAHVRVAVNLSAVQVLSDTLIADIRVILQDTGLPPQQLELEVTETLLLNDDPATHEALLQIRALGVAIALDDFGTGYASLGYLRRFPFNKLKIDQTFVRDITDQKTSTAIVRAVASLAKSLDIIAVAEGVETKAHLARVAAAGCTLVQGYLFSRPVPATEILQVIATCTVPKLEDSDWLTTASRQRG